MMHSEDEILRALQQARARFEVDTEARGDLMVKILGILACLLTAAAALTVVFLPIWGI